MPNNIKTLELVEVFKYSCFKLRDSSNSTTHFKNLICLRVISQKKVCHLMSRDENWVYTANGKRRLPTLEAMANCSQWEEGYANT